MTGINFSPVQDGTDKYVRLFEVDFQTLTNQYTHLDAGLSEGVKVRLRFGLVAVKGLAFLVTKVAITILSLPILPFSGDFKAHLLQANTCFIRVITLCFIGIFTPSEAFSFFRHEVIFANPRSSIGERLESLNSLRETSCAYLCESTSNYISRMFSNVLRSQGLESHTISSDGNCMFSALADQLGDAYHPEMDIRTKTHQLRQDAVGHLRAHKDEDPSNTGRILLDVVFDTVRDLVARREYICDAFKPSNMIASLAEHKDQALQVALAPESIMSAQQLRKAIEKKRPTLLQLPEGMSLADYCARLTTDPVWYAEQTAGNQSLKDFAFVIYCECLRNLSNQRLMEQLEQIPGMKDHLYTAYCNLMAESGTWGQGPEMRAVSELLERAIYVYSPQQIRGRRGDEPMPFDGNDVIAPLNIHNIERCSNPRDPQPLRVHYNGVNHYGSCRPARPF